MVDRHIEKMIATLKEKVRQETEPLTKTLSDYKQLLEKAKELEKKENKIRQSREDASIILLLTCFRHEYIRADHRTIGLNKISGKGTIWKLEK
jgi:hypothetical protein